MNPNGTPYGHSNDKLVSLEDIDDITLEDYGLTVDAVKSNHFGIDVTDPRTGEHLPDSFYEAKIEAAVTKVEKRLDIAILPRVLSEHHDLYRNNFQSNMYIHTMKKPIVQVEDIRMEYGGSTVYKYPSEWWRVYKLHGHIKMQPTVLLGGNQAPLNIAQAYTGYPVMAGFPGYLTNQSGSAPQMFHVEYVAGMLPPTKRGLSNTHEMHPDLWEVIVKMALKEVFQQYGRLILGPGIAGMRMNIDGVSQEIESTQSAMYGGASAEILQLDSDIKELLSGLDSYYGINLGII